MKAEGFADAGDPEFGAGGGEDELVTLLLQLRDFFKNLRVRELREPVGEEAIDVFLELLGGHSPKVGVEDALHAARTEDLIEGQEEDENEGEQDACGFLPEDVRAKDQLGVPGDDGLIEIEEGVFRGGLHWWKV